MSSVSCVNHPIWAWEASPQDAPIAYAGLLMIIGNLHRSQQRFKDALEVFEKAQNAFESSGATATTDYLQLLSQLAGFHYEQVGFMKGDDLFVSWWYFGNVGNMSQMFAQCGFLLYGFLRFPTDSSLDDRGISTLRWRNIPMRKPHMRPGRPKLLTCGRNRFKVGPTLRHISVNRVTLTRVWGHWRKPIFYRGNMFSTRWDGCLSDCPVAGGWLHRNRRLRSCLARPWKPFPFVFPIRAGHEILTNHLRLPSCLSAVFQLPSFLLMWFEFHTFSTQVLVQFIPNWDGLKRRWAKWLKLRKPFRLAWGWQRWGMQGTCSIYLNMYICYTIIS